MNKIMADLQPIEWYIQRMESLIRQYFSGKDDLRYHVLNCILDRT